MKRLLEICKSAEKINQQDAKKINIKNVKKRLREVMQKVKRCKIYQKRERLQTKW